MALQQTGRHCDDVTGMLNITVCCGFMGALPSKGLDSVADLRGREGRAPHWGPNSFNFIAVVAFGKIWQNRMLAPPPRSSHRLLGEILDPPLGLVIHKNNK